MIFRWIQYIGIFLIISFSTVSIFQAFYLREIDTLGDNSSFIKNYSTFFEDRFFDLRMKLTLPSSDVQDNRIVLAAIDDESLNHIGRWPWPRFRLADLIKKLDTFGAKIIGFDVFLSEPELACKGETSNDVLLANQIRDFQKTPGKKIILPYSIGKKQLVDLKIEVELDEKKDKIKTKADREELINRIRSEYFQDPPDALYFLSMTMRSSGGIHLNENVVQKKVFPISAFTDAEADLAHIEARSDDDGVFRHYQLVANVNNIYLPSFSLLAYQHFTGDNTKIIIESFDKAHLLTQKGRINVNALGESKLRWFGGATNFPVVSVKDILDSKDDDQKMYDLFRGKIVMVGSTAFGAHDFRNTPIDQMLPGVFYHMNMVNMLLEGRYFVDDVKSNYVTWAMMAIGTILMVLIMLFNNPILDLIFVNLIVGTLFVLDVYYFIPLGYNNKLFFSMFSVLGCYSWSTFIHFYQTNKEKKKIKGTFSRYLAPSIVNDLLKNPQKLKLGGEKKVITVFFSDVRDFTTISEKLTPEQLSHALNLYMTMMTDTLFEYKGTLDKYIGDAMVAYWGAPVDLPDNAYWAVKGAIQMIEKLPAINEEFEKLGYPKFKHGIGLNTGECSVGNMGSNQIFSYTALGDNMNLGARLESLCKYYGVQLNVSEYTINSLPKDKMSEFVFRTLDKVRVKGKEKAVTIYEILHPSHTLYNATEDLISYEEGFQAYLKMDFEKAKAIFSALHEKYPEDPSSERMLHTTLEFIQNPPPADWDGTFTHKSK